MSPEEFVNVYTLPMSRFDSPYFEYYLEMLDPYFGTKSLWESAKDCELDVFGKININRKQGHEQEVFYDKYIRLVATSLTAKEGYDEFLWESPTAVHSNYPSKVYKPTLVGEKLVSFDLKSANYQMLSRYLSLPESFVEYAESLGVPTAIAKSKRFRQICLNSLGDQAAYLYTTLSKNTMVELSKQLETQGTVVAVMQDEVLMLDEGQEFTYHFDYSVNLEEEHFTLGAFAKETKKGYQLFKGNTFYAKRFSDCTVSFHATPKDYYPMMVKYMNNEPLTELEFLVKRNQNGTLVEVRLLPLDGSWKFEKLM